MTRPAEVVAALERLASLEEGIIHFCADDVAACREAAALLRAESQPEPAPWPEQVSHEVPSGTVQGPTKGVKALTGPQPEPAPVGSEDVELIRVARGAALSPVIERPVRNLLEDLATRLETALADVARLDRIIESWKREEEAWIEREKKLMADVARLTADRDDWKVASAAWELDYIGARADFDNASKLLTEARADVAREREANAVLKATVISMGRATNEARAALATAEEAKAKAVAEEREACRMIAANYALNCVDSAGRFAANTIGERIRARAGRNDAG